MDHPELSRRTSLGSFFNRRNVKTGVTITETFLEDADNDNNSLFSQSSSESTFVQQTNNKQFMHKFSKKVAMTPCETRVPIKRSESSSSLVSKFKGLAAQTKRDPPPPQPVKKRSVGQAHNRFAYKWTSFKDSNKTALANDPLIHAENRLHVFLEYYDTYLINEDTDHLFDNEDLIQFWTISTLKYLTGVHLLVTNTVLTEFENFELKQADKIRILKIDNKVFSTEWAWQLAMDNVASEVYNYTTVPIHYNINPNNKIGPTNFHPVHGRSLSELPFSKNSFSFELAYDLFFQLKEDEWVGVLSELYRVLQPGGSLTLFLTDFIPLNCVNNVYANFFSKVKNSLIKNGLDPMPCKKIHSRLKEAGFEDINYSLISLKKGLPNKLGNMMDLMAGFIEYIMFDRIAKYELTEEELIEFKNLKLKYHQDLRDGKLVEEFGDVYFMFLFAKK